MVIKVIIILLLTINFNLTMNLNNEFELDNEFDLAEDGCIEDFENTAAFTRDYQASQDCMCDSEHMFDCPGNTDENELETLARSIQNEGLMDTTLNKIADNMDEHKVVAKKFFSKKVINYI